MSWVDTLPEHETKGSARAERLRTTGGWVSNATNKAPLLAFLGLTVLYAVVVTILSSLKLLWLDELITLHIARLGSVHAIWSALRLGADPNPPLTHLLVGAFRSIFGEHELALRAPAALGYWVGLLSLFLYLKRRLPPVWALCGTVLSVTMAGFDYSFESRSYGIFYGLTMLAFYCWTVAADSTVQSGKRQVALWIMACALALGLCTNYFSVLAFVPIMLGEGARTFQKLKRYSPTRSALNGPDRHVWFALLLASTPLVVFYPLISRAVSRFGPYAFNHVSGGQIVGSYTEMVEAMLFPLLALFLFAGWLRWARSGQRMGTLNLLAGRLKAAQPALPFHERVGVAGLLGYPLWGFLVASAYGGMFSPRFVIPVCLGFAIAGAVTMFAIVGDSPRAGTSVLCFCLAWFCAREAYVGYVYLMQKQAFEAVLNHLAEAERNVPEGTAIVVPDPLLALTLQHYAPLPIRRRLMFPVDFPAVRQYRGDDSPEQNLWAGRGTWYVLPIMTLAEFQHNAGRYLIVAGEPNWLLTDLHQHKYTVTRLPIDSGGTAMGGFTPLSHGVPAYYVAQGDLVHSGPAEADQPVRFALSANLPASHAAKATGAAGLH